MILQMGLWDGWCLPVHHSEEDITDCQSEETVCVCVCVSLLSRDDHGHQGVLQGDWWWNMAASLGVQVLLNLTHRRFITSQMYYFLS